MRADESARPRRRRVAALQVGVGCFGNGLLVYSHDAEAAAGGIARKDWKNGAARVVLCLCPTFVIHSPGLCVICACR